MSSQSEIGMDEPCAANALASADEKQRDSATGGNTTHLFLPLTFLKSESTPIEPVALVGLMERRIAVFGAFSVFYHFIGFGRLSFTTLEGDENSL